MELKHFYKRVKRTRSRVLGGVGFEGRSRAASYSPIETLFRSRLTLLVVFKTEILLNI